MKIQHFTERLQSLGASEREAELIAANYFGGSWMDAYPTKITNEQREAMLTLIADRREEDEQNAWITNEHMSKREAAGYHVDWKNL